MTSTASIVPQDVEKYKEVLNDYSAGACGKHVTVYCWSRTDPGTERWAIAESLGRQLAAEGFGIVTGGYCGSMEAVAKGAREATCSPGSTTTPKPIPVGHVERHEQPVAENQVPVRGVLVPGQFPDRVLVGNPFNTESVDTASLMRRLDVLSALTRYYIALPGTLGTLTEIAVIWSLALLHKQGAPLPVILLWRDPWEAAMKGLEQALKLPNENMVLLRYVDSPEECVRIISEDYATEMGRQ
jgi:predicted Rossmann-fold nucleotide-binding protein